MGGGFSDGNAGKIKAHALDRCVFGVESWIEPKNPPVMGVRGRGDGRDRDPSTADLFAAARQSPRSG